MAVSQDSFMFTVGKLGEFSLLYGALQLQVLSGSNPDAGMAVRKSIVFITIVWHVLKMPW